MGAEDHCQRNKEENSNCFHFTDYIGYQEEKF
jgi:hypothetical protein